MKRTAFPLSYFLLIISYSLFSCKTTAQISRKAGKLLITDTAISKGFIGISVFDPSTNSYLYNYNADKYFVPASNVKLFTLYAGMKYLGDSLVGIRYQEFDNNTYNIFPTGDPTLLHPDFIQQPVASFLRQKGKRFLLSYLRYNWRENPLGFGWAWDDYNEDFMVERSSFPIYGNVIRIFCDSIYYNEDKAFIKWNITPGSFSKEIKNTYSIPWLETRTDSITTKKKLSQFYIKRAISNNKLSLEKAKDSFVRQIIPFYTDNDNTIVTILNNLGVDVKSGSRIIRSGIMDSSGLLPPAEIKKIYSQPSDSLFKPMMHLSDNFFAEQTLLMASNEHLGYMSDEDIIDTLLKSDLKDVPHKPRWVDGSGLSRYNLFTPQDFIYILNKMKNEFGMERMKTILATGGEGTLKNYFRKDAGFIYAKTGTLSNNCALSGYIITKKNRLLIFSILANNYQTGATPVRKAVEKFVQDLREKY